MISIDNINKINGYVKNGKGQVEASSLSNEDLYYALTRTTLEKMNLMGQYREIIMPRSGKLSDFKPSEEYLKILESEERLTRLSSQLNAEVAKRLDIEPVVARQLENIVYGIKETLSNPKTKIRE